MSKEPNVIQAWAEAMNSGGYVHPETEKNMPGIPKEEPLYAPLPPTAQKKETSWKSIAVLLLSILLSGGGVYYAKDYVEPPQRAEVPGEEHNWIAGQTAAWERLAERALADYYRALERNLPHPGLCITTGTGTACKPGAERIPLRLH